jgi:aminotransferase
VTARLSQRASRIQLSQIRQIDALATPDSLNLGIGEPNVRPDETLKRKAVEAIDGSWSYSPNAGLASVREAIAASCDSAVDPSTELCVTAGTEEALYCILQALVDPGDEVLVPDPGFAAYPTLVKLAGGEPVEYGLEAPAWSLDVERLERAITPLARAIIVNSPSNPTGGVFGDAELEQLAAVAARHDLVVISDEVYREIHFGDRPPSMQGREGKVIVVDGLSKSHSMTGLRIGWAIGPEALMQTVIKVHQYVTTCASVASQRLAESILSDRDWNRSWLNAMRAQVSRQQKIAIDSVERFLHQPLDPPRGSFYLFVPVPSCDTLTVAKRIATEAGVLTIPGSAFGLRGEGFLRISCAASEETIEEGIRRIGEWLDHADTRET